MSTAIVAIIAGAALIAVLYAIRTGRRIEAQVGSMHVELSPNGGHSVKDRVEQIVERLLGVEETLISMDEAFWLLDGRVSALEGNPSPGRFDDVAKRFDPLDRRRRGA